MISANLFTFHTYCCLIINGLNVDLIISKRESQAMIKIIQRSKSTVTRLKFDHDGVLSLKHTSELIRHYLILQVGIFRVFEVSLYS